MDNRLSCLGAVARRASQLFRTRIALQAGAERITYGELAAAIADMSHFLHSHGISSRDIVLFIFDNTPSSIVCFLSLACSGARVIPLERQTVSSQDLRLIFEDLRFTAVINAGSPQREHIRLLSQGDCTFVDLLQPINARVDRDECETGLCDVSETFLYHYTSGSTGHRKAAMHTQANLVKGGMAYSDTYHIRPDDNILVAVPLAHSFGMVGAMVSSLYSGSTLILVDRVIPHHIASLVVQSGATVLFGSPLMYDLLARCELDGVGRANTLRVCLSSGARLLPETAEGFEQRYGRQILQIYGSTETGVVAGQWPRDSSWPASSVGLPMPGVLVRIADDLGCDLPADKAGMVMVKSPTTFLGYHNDLRATQRAFQDGWYVTGDIGWRDGAGHLFITGRKETFINVGGRKVNPADVEDVLLTHPMVGDAIVYGEDAGVVGEQICADVVLLGETSCHELMRFCRHRLASFQVPLRISPVESIPKGGFDKQRRLPRRPLI